MSCKQKKTPSPGVISHVNSIGINVCVQNDALSFDSVYTFPDGTKIQLTTLKFYTSQISCGSSILCDYALFDFSLNKHVLFSNVGNLPNSDTLSFGIGVPMAVNHNDPSAFPNSSPLNSLIANDMHWDWNPGYIFVKIEGKADTIANGNLLLDHVFTYHMGMDANYLNKQLIGANWQSAGNVSSLNLKLDIYEVFNRSGNEINIKTESTTHSAVGQEVLTGKVRDNFTAAITLP